MKWMPIESAPRDGTLFLAVYDNKTDIATSGHQQLVFARWHMKQ